MPHHPVYLASTSPRRQELLAQIGVAFSVVTAEIDETPSPQEEVLAYLQRMAKQKALAAQSLLEYDAWIIAGDTSLLVDGQILGKPVDADDAQAMLQRLSGRSHQVYSAVALCHQDTLLCAVSITEVTFAPLPVSDIAAYVASGEPMDKAGAYAIQGYAARWVKNINGSYSGVMGLPLFELNQLLEQANFPYFNPLKKPMPHEK
ncbi:Maf-like protein [Thiosulfatimonas sediminis]|uniref:dTTP/UTP pyrophosphatase n=1 Tax=Thiosulfatimonas sediminis TaxID=2675054 RepID=A0A6F8PX84_9GAMM|nr:Maf family protein [Thiosulfatimonas sediminis]BBP46614.1 Maf-like protein [Thiosulfatimonas sediminis]